MLNRDARLLKSMQGRLIWICKMVCEETIRKMEERLKRKLTSEEKKRVEEKMHHSEINDEKPLEAYV